MNKFSVFIKMLDDQIEHFSREAKKHKDMYRNSRYLVSILGAFSSVLAAMTILVDDAVIKIAIVAASAISGFIAFREGLRKPYELWMNERTTCHALHDLKRNVEFYLDENSTKEKIEEMYKQMQDIIIASGNSWKSIVSPHPKTEDQKK